MISYELILSSAILIVVLLTGSFNFTTIIECQQSVWFILPLLPIFIFYFISILAETSRTPFDLNEAESELVAGFFTEHSSIIFVFFFLAEYSSIVLFSCITSILFLGGYNMPELFVNETFVNLQAVVLGLKTCLFCFMFVWFRATLPRLRYDQLVELCWLYLLPVAIAFVILVPCILISFDIAPLSCSLVCIGTKNVRNKIKITTPYTPILNKRSSVISTNSTNGSKLTDEEFAHWFSGFSDAESCFIILIPQEMERGRIIFRFQIKLHLDDLKVLEYIHQRLEIGSVRVDKDKAIFTVVSPKELLNLLSLFEIKPLNTKKYLNYLAFKEALLLYLENQGNPNKQDLIVEQIREIKNTMNTQRTNFELPESHKIVITPYWLLGFVEGDGSFNVSTSRTRNFMLNFNLSQVIDEIKVFEAIRSFILELPGSYKVRKKTTNQVGIVIKNTIRSPAHKQQIQLNVNDSKFISAILIPFFDNLTFLSKKGLDYIDWKSILELKEKGWHLSSYGASLIKALATQMNDNRLSTNKNLSSSELTIIDIDTKVKELLSQPSNFEVHSDGRIYIKSEHTYWKGRGNVEL